MVLAAAVSSDGSLLATGGTDKLIHVWDVRANKHVQAFSGHRGAVHGLSFREGTKTLFSASDDRCVKIWSLEDMSYVDTLFGELSNRPCLRHGHIRFVHLN
jgi:ribosomal RNA-processing protein 9